MSLIPEDDDDMALATDPEVEVEDEDPCMCNPCECDMTDTPKRKSGEVMGEDDGQCLCDPCECETPPGSPDAEKEEEEEVAEAEVVEEGASYQLDEFMRAKAYFLNTSSKSGISLYDHLSDVIRKLLDERAPDNPVDYFEEVSMNVKRYRFQGNKDVLKDVFQISEPVLNDARYLSDNWNKYAKWSEERKETGGEGDHIGGSFQNLLRLQYYLEQVNVGLPREEMFRIALAVKDLTTTRPYITRARLWGKVFGTLKSYYVIEAELKQVENGQRDIWQPEEVPEDPEEGEVPPTPAIENVETEVPEEKVPGAQQTMERAGNVVLDSEFLTAYSKTSGLPPEEQSKLLPKPTSYTLPNKVINEDAGEDGMLNGTEFEDAEAIADALKWQKYQKELMENFPVSNPDPEVLEVAVEAEGIGANRRAFYVCNELGSPWFLLPAVSPRQINASRRIRWYLTGDLNAEIKSYPLYPGKEGHFLKAMLTRAASGSLVSPMGFYKPGKYGGEFPGEDDEDYDEEEGEDGPGAVPGNDSVNPTKKYKANMIALTNSKMDFWVHHAGYILPQGRFTWWNPNQKPPKVRKNTDDSSEEESEDEDDEYEGEGQEFPHREVGPRLFSPLSADVYADGTAPWSLRTSSTVFTEFQVASVRSNVWPGAAVICTIKGKVDNIYFGDGLKFADRCYSPLFPGAAMTEYKAGPELEEFPDPSVEEEQTWLNRLQLNEIADEVEPRSMDNEEEETYDEDEEEDVSDAE